MADIRRADDGPARGRSASQSPAAEALEQRHTFRARSFHLGLVLACVGAALTLVPLWAPLLVASWLALVLRPCHAWLAARVRGSAKAAAVTTVVLVVAALTPVVLVTLSLVSAAATLIERVQAAGGPREALEALLSSAGSAGGSSRLDPEQLMSFVRGQGGGVLDVARRIFGAATTAGIGLVVFLYGFYTFLINGRRVHDWLLDHSPLERWETLRLSNAYVETGRGLLIAVGLTALFQGVVATVGYLVASVPQALVLGLLTTIAALIPTLGTALVWAPLALGLLLGGRVPAAVAVLVIGGVTAVADNFVRPALSRRAQLDLPMFVVFIAMLGGITMFGAWGLLLGPLFVRIGLEALRIGRERRELGDPEEDR